MSSANRLLAFALVVALVVLFTITDDKVFFVISCVVGGGCGYLLGHLSDAYHRHPRRR